jgi:hypothetical protein
MAAFFYFLSDMQGASALGGVLGLPKMAGGMSGRQALGIRFIVGQ